MLSVSYMPPLVHTRASLPIALMQPALQLHSACCRGRGGGALARTMSAVDVIALTAGAAASSRTSGAHTASCGTTAAPNSTLATCGAAISMLGLHASILRQLRRPCCASPQPRQAARLQPAGPADLFFGTLLKQVQVCEPAAQAALCGSAAAVVTKSATCGTAILLKCIAAAPCNACMTGAAVQQDATQLNIRPARMHVSFCAYDLHYDKT